MKKIIDISSTIIAISIIGLMSIIFVLPQGAFAQVQESTATVTINTDGTTSDIEQSNGKMYVGGNYQNIEIEGKKYSHANFSIVDVTNKILSPLQHNLNGPVEDILSFNGNIYVAGEFTEVDGKSHPYIVAFSEETGQIVELPFSVGGPIHSFAIYDSIMVVGGNFDDVKNEKRMNFFEYDTQENTLTDWAPEFNDVVYEILIVDNSIIIGGAFTSVDGSPRTKLAAFDLDTKELMEWAPQIEGTVMDMSQEENGLLVVTYQDGKNNTIEEVEYRVDPNTGDAAIIGQTVVTPTAVVVISGMPSVTTTANNLDLMVDKNALGFIIPSLGDLLTFAVRTFFAIAGIAAMFYLLMGAFNWVISGGDKDNIAAARDKIQAAVVGLIMMVVVLSLIWTLEQIIFKRRICLGVSCPVTLPSLIDPTP